MKNGFSLIELIVVVSVMGVLMGMGVVSFVKFSDDQDLLIDVNDFVTRLTRVRSDSRAIYYPEGCVGLSGFSVSALAGQNVITVSSDCVVGGSSEDIKIFGNSEFVEDASMKFVVGSTLIDGTVFEIKSNSGNVTKLVEVDDFGAIEVK